MKKVAIQGYAGSFHHIAAQQYQGAAVEILPCDTFRAVARAVESGEVDYGVMAIENSIAGSILPNYKILQQCNIHICGEIYLQIRQNLMVNRGVKLEDIVEVESHQMALLQCAEYLDAHPWRLVESADTALSAAQLQQSGSRTTAAVAGALAAELFDLDIIAADIHTNRNNYTRFLILERLLCIIKLGFRTLKFDVSVFQLRFFLCSQRLSLLQAALCLDFPLLRRSQLLAEITPLLVQMVPYGFHA